jgi:putative phosphoesterase
MEPIAVLADIHGNLPALEVVVADIERRGITTVLNLGDHASGPLWPAETLAFLMQQPWIQIVGNHDRQLVRTPPDEHGESDRYAFAQLDPHHLAWLSQLPATVQHSAEILLCHGTPHNDNQYLLETVAGGTLRLATPAEIEARLGGTSALVLCGHSHVPRVVQLPGRLLVNPGSVGLQAYRDDTPEVHVMATGAPVARYALLHAQRGGWRIELVALPYDHQRAANQARKNGRPDWAIALATGFLD